MTIKAAPVDDQQVRRLAAGLRTELTNQGVSEGDRVAVHIGNNFRWLSCRLAIADLGAVAVSLYTMAPASDIDAALDFVGADYIVTASHTSDTARPINIDDVTPTSPMTVSDYFGATLIFTSGTTGDPKACFRTTEQESQRGKELASTYNISSDDVHLVSSPLPFSAPGIFTRTAMKAGAKTIVLNTFSGKAFVDAVNRFGVTFAFIVPTQLFRIVEYLRSNEDTLPSMRALIIAGAPLHKHLRLQALKIIGAHRLWQFYGSSETGTISVLRPEDWSVSGDSVGKPLPSVTLHNRDPDKSGIGTFFVDSPTVMTGYWNPVTNQPDKRLGPVSVGDMGYIDKAGFVHLLGRGTDLIISGGVNVYPGEVERALVALPEIDAAVVFGVADEEWGQKVAAAVCLSRPVDFSLIRAKLRDNLALYKIPKGFVCVDPGAIPLTSSGKPIRRTAATLGDDVQWLQ